MTLARTLTIATACLALAACAREGELTEFGITTSRSACPLVSAPAATGNVTMLEPGRTDAGGLDVVATITGLRSTCVEAGEQITATATYIVAGQRRDASGARTVQLPVYSSVLQGGRVVVAKRLGTATLQFAAGAPRGGDHGDDRHPRRSCRRDPAR